MVSYFLPFLTLFLKPRSSLAGYTLIEMVLVILIVGLLGISGAVIYINAQQRAIFDNTFQGVVSKVREMRNFAVSRKTIVIQDEERVPRGGYGLFLEPQNATISVFVDTWNDELQAEVDTDVTPPLPLDHIFTPNRDVLLETISLPPNVSLTELRNAQGQVIIDPIAITFLPPEAENFIVNNNSLAEIDEIVVVFSGGQGATKQFRLHRISRFPIVE